MSSVHNSFPAVLDTAYCKHWLDTGKLPARIVAHPLDLAQALRDQAPPETPSDALLGGMKALEYNGPAGTCPVISASDVPRGTVRCE